MGGRGAKGTSSSKATAASAKPKATPKADGAGGAGGNGYAGTVDGKDISGKWDQNSYGASAIEDVMDAQGFRGKPKVITDDAEFEAAVSAAWGGNGLRLYRGYNAPDKETLDAYSDDLRNGEWYVACGGGAMYGMGQYAGYSYGGKKGSRSEIHARNTARIYANGGQSRPFSKVEEMTLAPDAKVIEYSKLSSQMSAENRKRSKSGKPLYSDEGVFAAAKGYDFYYDRRSGYSVTLNRTKLIIKGK